MEKIDDYFRFTLFIVFSFAIVYSLNFSLNLVFGALLKNYSTTIMISSLIVALLFMVIGTICFGSVAFLVRKLNSVRRKGVIIVVPVCLHIRCGL